MNDGTNQNNASAVAGAKPESEKPAKKDMTAAAVAKPKGTPNGKSAKAKKIAKGSKKAKGGKVTKPAKADKKAKPGKSINARIEATDGCPFRPTSSYGKLWLLLLKHKDKGISRADYIKEGAKITGKPVKNVTFDVAVVASPTKEGTAHPSANRAADSYWVERTEGGLLKLHKR